jgi:anti-sigma factor RsiW
MIEDLPCQELVELITEYLEGTLPQAERERFDAHLAVCPPCRVYLEQMRRTIGVLGKLTPASLSPAVQEDLLEAFRDWKRGAPPVAPEGA